MAYYSSTSPTASTNSLSLVAVGVLVDDCLLRLSVGLVLLIASLLMDCLFVMVLLFVLPGCFVNARSMPPVRLWLAVAGDP